MYLLYFLFDLSLWWNLDDLFWPDSVWLCRQLPFELVPIVSTLEFVFTQVSVTTHPCDRIRVGCDVSLHYKRYHIIETTNRKRKAKNRKREDEDWKLFYHKSFDTMFSDCVFAYACDVCVVVCTQIYIYIYFHFHPFAFRCNYLWIRSGGAWSDASCPTKQCNRNVFMDRVRWLVS